MEPVYLDTPEYTVEVWDINNVFIADISKYIATSLRMDWSLNDIDEIAFTLDLVQFELFCQSIGARPMNVIEPYRTDIKIRRNGEYIIGAHVVQVSLNLNNEETNKLMVQCTGYLNHFKDRVISGYYDNMTYSEIARRLIEETQESYNQISNPNFRTGINGWQAADSAYIIWDQNIGNLDSGSLFVNVSGASTTYGGARWNFPMQAGVEYTANFWVRTMITTGTVYVASEPSIRRGEVASTTTNWTEYTITWTQGADSSFFDIRTDGNVDFWIDNVSLTDNIDNASRRSFGVTLGTDTATPVQDNGRVRTYDMQNIKDAVINLTKLESDNFDFKFDANKVFYTYDRLGTDKPQYELVYPQNITSMSTVRDAQTLGNKIYALGSGIGDERLESTNIDQDSATVYRVRERTELFSTVERQDTLDGNAYGKLQEYKDMYDKITVKLSTNVLDLNAVELGDAIYLRVDNSTYIDYIDGLYRIVEMSVDVSIDIEEDVTLTLTKWSEI